MKRKSQYILISLLLFNVILSEPINVTTANTIANFHLEVINAPDSVIVNNLLAISGEYGDTLFYLANLSPKGFIAVSSNTDIEPIISYSMKSNFIINEDPDNVLYQLIIADMEFRNEHLNEIPVDVILVSHEQWTNYINNDSSILRDNDFQSWPPEGSTDTGGWIETIWSQTGEFNQYNGLCPIDPSTGNRSFTGCVATAMSQVLNYHRYIGDKVWDDQSDGYISRGGELSEINIFEDSGILSFPTAEELNIYLDGIRNNNYIYNTGLDDNEPSDFDYIRALNFACGVATHMQYSSFPTIGSSSSISPSDFLDDFQYQFASSIPYESFNFLYFLSQNLMNGQVAILTITNPSHALLCDGYNSNGEYHLNFGHGSEFPLEISECWYNIDNMPFSQNDYIDDTYITSAIINISPPGKVGAINGHISIDNNQISYSDVVITVGSLSTSSGNNGNFSIEIYNGIWEVTAELTGYNSDTETIQVIAGEVAQVNLELTEASGIEIHIASDGTQDYLSIQQGIEAASDNDIIIIHEGLYEENIEVIEKNLIIKSTYDLDYNYSAIENTVIDANSNGNPVEIVGNNTSISGLTVQNGFSNSSLIWGGGIKCVNSNPVLKDLIVTENHFRKGGGITLIESNAVIEKVNLTENIILQEGGAIFSLYSSPVIKNIIVHHNTADGIRFNNSGVNSIATNLTISDNFKNGISCYNSEVNIINSILYNNLSGMLQIGAGSEVNIYYSGLQENHSGVGNFFGNPLFTDPDNNDYSLTFNSPCVNSGIPYFEQDGIILVDLTFNEFNFDTPDIGAFETPYSKGEIILDLCINVVDIVYLVDFIQNPGIANDYELWASDMNLDAELTVDDLTLLADYILNHGSCGGGTQRRYNNSFITLNLEKPLSRGGGNVSEIILSTETDIRAAYFEFLFTDSNILNIDMVEEFSDMSLGWIVRQDTLGLLFYGANGQYILQGVHTIALIETDTQLNRFNSNEFDYIYGEYTDNFENLYEVEMTDKITPIIPDQFSLHIPYPNPFNPVTTISFDLPTDCDINISIYNVKGEFISEIKSGFIHAGSYNFKWNAANKSSGLYFVRLTTDKFSETQKIILLK